MQKEFFPLSALELVAACRRLEAKIVHYAPELTAKQLERVLGELAISNRIIEELGLTIRQGEDYQRRMALPDSLGSAPPSAGLLDHVRARRWRTPKPVMLYPSKGRRSAKPSVVAGPELPLSEVPDELHSSRPEAVPGD